MTAVLEEAIVATLVLQQDYHTIYQYYVSIV